MLAVANRHELSTRVTAVLDDRGARGRAGITVDCGIDYGVLYRWFVGLGMDEPIWSPTTFSKNRDRLPASDVAAASSISTASGARTTRISPARHIGRSIVQKPRAAVLKKGLKRAAFERPGIPLISFAFDIKAPVP